MPDESAQPATKADISLLRAELATKSELQEGITRLDKKIDRVAIEVVKTNERIGQLGEGLRQDMRQLNSDVTAKLDAFIGKMETIWKESAVLPRVVDEQAEKLQDHEKRLKTLESARP